MTNVKNVLPPFVQLNDIQPAESSTTLIYGGSKTGKTDFMGTAGDRMLFINNGLGIETFFGKRFKDRPINPIVVTLKADEKTEQYRVYDQIKDIIDHALDNLSDRFDTIAIDDSTAFRRSAMLVALQFNKDTGKSKSLDASSKYDISIPAVQDYGTEMEFTSSFIAQTISICKEAKKHFIMGAHERLTFKKGAGIGDIPSLVRITPSFTGVDKNPDYISGLFDNVWHTEAVGGGERTIYRIRTVGDETLTAGTRYSGIFKEIEKDLRFTDVISRIKQFHLENK